MSGTSVVLRRPTLLGVATAVVFFCGSLVPGLLPQSWSVQGIISGFLTALGYGLGASVSGLCGTMVRRRPGRAIQTGARSTLLALGSGVSAWASLTHYRWQVDVRRLMGMSTAILYYPVAIAVVAILVAVALVLLARMVRAGYRRYVTLLARSLPRAGAHAVGVITSVVLAVFLTDVVLTEQVVSALDRRYLATDARDDRALQRPASPYRSGGPGSLVAWEALGRHGRAFVAQGPGTEELAAFSGRAAVEPIRVYVGRRSASPTARRAEVAVPESAAQRAALAVAELERTGAFRRRLLVLVTPTGTGWVDPSVVTPLEYLYNGDTAAVAIQYSYLPSWAVLLGNQEQATEAARALIAAVEERLRREPAATRPRLLIYGQSLGAFAAEAAFTGLDDIKRRTDGALLVGPPGVSRLWREFTADRDPGSPLWQPVYRRGETVRFGHDGRSLAEPASPWARPRVAYLQHASDPITWWSPALLTRRPAWLDEPRGPDVSRRMGYYPVATFLRVTVDLVLGLGAPPGHGHRYGVAQAEAWALLIPPEGWDPDDTRRLVTAVEAQNALASASAAP